jgi:predicted secreted Zn-dependent protease
MKFILPALLWVSVAMSRAEDSFIIRTNAYAVSGTTAREIRLAIDHQRPWKEPQDASTVWGIKWAYTTVSSDVGCQLRTLDIKTSVSITIPRWTVDTAADDDLKKRWQTYSAALLAHEDGHKRIAMAAAAEIKNRVNKIKSAPTCAQLESTISLAANKVIEDFRQREKAYDERTAHGRTQGAVFP